MSDTELRALVERLNSLVQNVHQYVGARYVPNFIDEDWNDTTEYHALDVVNNGQGTAYIAKKPVPVGTPLTNRDYWFVYGAYSGAILHLQEQIDDLVADVNNIASVKMFGAVGDGVTDDTQAFNDCFAAYDTVIIPDGTYKLSSSFGRITGKTVIGYGATLKLDYELQFRKCSITGVTFISDHNLSAFDNAEFIDCTFNGSSLPSDHSTMLIALADGGKEYTFKRCTFSGSTNASFGIWCDVAGNNGGSLHVQQCYFNSMWLNAIFTSLLKNNIEECTFWNNHIQADPRGGGQIDFVRNTGNSNTNTCIVKNNTFYQPAATSENTCHVETEGGQQIIIEGNYFNSTGVVAASIVLQTSARANIISNTFTGDANRTAVATFNGSKVIASGNYFINFGTHYSDMSDVISATDFN